ncbi:3-phosphoglycerate dehydrogenase family protein [Clostridiaceae bacterium OttesenSCG-928-D20]|nr:3-phosphoglycerate dehydrogenase family protein [Clostridiaceae bacterium OttesenSCG-928-D20]
MYSVKTLNKISEKGLNILERHEFNVGSEIDNPDSILLRSFKMHDYEIGDRLLAVARAGVGTNNIPTDEYTQKGIVVFNTPGANAEAVKELAICAILMGSRDVLGGIEWVRSISGSKEDIPKMIEKGKSSFAGPEIAGKTLGVIGLGAIGAKIANTAYYLGMEVYGYDPFLSVDAAWKLSRNVQHAMDLDTIYKNCDYISLHIPYLPDTHHMLNDDAFGKMRDGVRIINMARGELVDDDAMIRALDTAKVARYITDFPNEKTASVPNIVPMPHIGASTPESEEKCAEMAARQLVDYLKNGNIINSVNLPNANLERLGAARICIIHKNVPKMINRFLSLISDENINVEHMLNKPKGELAYTIIDTDQKICDCILSAIAGMGEVLRVRVL